MENKGRKRLKEWGVTMASATQRSKRLGLERRLGLGKQFHHPSGGITNQVSSARVKEGTNGLFNSYLWVSICLYCLPILFPS